jgi:hypothetical protein
MSGFGSSMAGTPLFSAKRYKSPAKSNHTRSKSINNITVNTSLNLNTIRKTENVFLYNLSPDHQHVKSSFLDTSKSVKKLREAAQEKRVEMRTKLS